MYGSWINVLRDKRTFYHNETKEYVVGKQKAIEIDKLCDFIALEAIHKYYYPAFISETSSDIDYQNGTKNRKYGL